VKKDKTVARQGWKMAREAMASHRYHLVVLDEFTYLLAYQMIELQTVLDGLNEPTCMYLSPAEMHRRNC
jgi:cob(I)alamin adenosyltransferase